MSAITFLEQLAYQVFHRVDLGKAAANQATDVKEALRTNNPVLLKKFLSNDDYYANEEEVVRE